MKEKQLCKDCKFNVRDSCVLLDNMEINYFVNFDSAPIECPLDDVGFTRTRVDK